MSNSPILAVFVLSLLAGRGQAQCPTFQAGTFRAPGLGANAAAQIVFDDGNGPALYVAGGEFLDGIGEVPIVRWRSNHWEPLVGGLNLTTVFALAVHDDGFGPRLYASAFYSTPAQLTNSGIVRWDGSTWSLVGGLVGNANALCSFDPDDAGPAPRMLMIGGGFSEVAGVAASRIAAWDGSTWSGLGTGVTGVVWSLAVFDPDGTGPTTPKLYVGGLFNNAGPLSFVGNIASWDGTSWSSVGGGTTGGQINALCVFDPDAAGPNPELLMVGGSFTQVGGFPSLGCGAWTGSAWLPFQFTVPGTAVRALIVHDEDGAGPQPATLFAGGDFIGAGLSNVARRTGSTWTAVAEGVNARVASLISFDDGSGPRLYAAGQFVRAGTQRAQYIARWDGIAWSALLPGNSPSGIVRSLQSFDDGSGPALFVGGDFEYAGAVPANHIARWDGSSWSALGAGVNAAVLSMCAFDDGTGKALYLGGSFTLPGSTAVARWNGSTLTPVGSGLGGTVLALATFDDGSGLKLYAGGTFGLRRWDGSGWTTPAGNLAGGVNALVVHDEGDGLGPALFAGGAFLTAGGVPANRIARWRGNAWSPLGSGANATVRVLTSFEVDGTPMLVAAGSFGIAGGNVAARGAQWSQGAWHPLWEVLIFPGGGEPRAMCVHDDGSGNGAALYLGGFLASIEGVPTPGVARWDGHSFSTVAGGTNAGVEALAAFDSGQGTGAELYLGGYFSGAGDVESVYLARLSNCGETGAVVCAGDGSSGACPCGNESQAGSKVGCLNSLLQGGSLRATGFASLDGDQLVLDGSGMPDGTALYFQATSSFAPGIAFGDGLLCSGGAFARLAVRFNAGGASSYPSALEAPISVSGAVPLPASRTYQVLYRDQVPYCSSGTFNTTNALRVHWVR